MTSTSPTDCMTPIEQANHTPGPWRLVRGHKEWRVLGREDGCYSVAEVIDGNGFPQNAANARLIAAAPELLEALQHAVDWLNAAGIAETMPVQQQARAAILKATGAKK